MGARNRSRSRGCNRSSGSALSVLLAAPGADVFFDADDLTRITKDGSDKVSLLASRIGVHTVEQATGANQPTWGSTSPSGRRGITFTIASSTRLIDPLTTLGALYTATQGYSALWVAKIAAPTTGQTVWSIGDSGSSSNAITEGSTATTATDSRIRFGSGSSTTNVGSVHNTTIVCVTSQFTGTTMSSWLNGATSIDALANSRSVAVDQLAIGARRLSGAFGSHFGGEFYGLILSRTQWTAAQRQALESAARSYWGTP